ncbi:Lipase [Ceratobasidium sp. AG-Ba]|nr:Lipase [Ceratobasidium sp. AG-Ba]
MERSSSSSDQQPPEYISKTSTHEPTALFAVGKSLGKPPLKRQTLAGRQATSFVNKPKSKPSKHAANYRNSNVSAPKTVPFAFPTTSSFTFSLADPSLKLAAPTTSKPAARTIEVLPTDVLITVVQSLGPKHHRPLLRSLSLVNQTLNTAVAPLLYRHFHLPSLPDVYEFSRGPRHPECISSLEINLSPDPYRRDWTPPDPSWAEGLICTLKRLDRLFSFGVNLRGNDSALQFLIEHAKDHSFLPALQKLSLGSWHQLSSLCPGRPITSYEVVFSLHERKAYERLEQLLISLSASDQTVRELKITFHVSLGEWSPMRDYQRGTLNLIGKHLPGLRVLKLRFQSRNSSMDATICLVEIVKLIPPTLNQLVTLEFFDSHFPLFSTIDTVSGATALTGPDGPCPNIQYVNFDGLSWKRTAKTSSSVSSTSTLHLQLTSLSLGDGKVGQTQSEVLAPLMTWTPSPSSKRGRNWWERRVPQLHASCQAQAVNLLWQWMAEHWGKEYMADIKTLERTVTRW